VLMIWPEVLSCPCCLASLTEILLKADYYGPQLYRKSEHGAAGGGRGAMGPGESVRLDHVMIARRVEPGRNPPRHPPFESSSGRYFPPRHPTFKPSSGRYCPQRHTTHLKPWFLLESNFIMWRAISARPYRQDPHLDPQHWLDEENDKFMEYIAKYAEDYRVLFLADYFAEYAEAFRLSICLGGAWEHMWCTGARQLLDTSSTSIMSPRLLS